MANSDQRPGLPNDGDPELLMELPSQRLNPRLPRLHLPPRKLPTPRLPLPRRPLRNEHAPFRVGHRGGNHVEGFRRFVLGGQPLACWRAP
jgi:hypothetical protein